MVPYGTQVLLAARIIVVIRQMKVMDAKSAALAERAYVLRMYESKTYVQIAEQLGYEGTADLFPAEAAMDAVQRFEAEVRAEVRAEPPAPTRRG
jgi:hypothetical protein